MRLKALGDFTVVWGGVPKTWREEDRVLGDFTVVWGSVPKTWREEDRVPLGVLSRHQGTRRVG